MKTTKTTKRNLKKAEKTFEKVIGFCSCLVLYVATLACYFEYMNATNIVWMIIMIVACVFWFYSFMMEIGHFLGFIKE